MEARVRKPQDSQIAVSKERDPFKGMSFLDNVVAWLNRQGGAGALYTEDHFRLQRRTDFIVAALLVLFFVGSFSGFIAWLAATR